MTMFRNVPALLALASLALALGCAGEGPQSDAQKETPTKEHPLLSKYTSFRLTSDLSHLTDDQRQMIPLLIEACQAMDEAFWIQAYGDGQELLASIEDPNLRRYAEINYGPWDRLAGNEPFIDGVGPKPEGANFYPQDVTREEFEKTLDDRPDLADQLMSEYTMVRRDESGQLTPIPYSEFFADQIAEAVSKLRQAVELAEDPGFKRYLELRIEALESDEYRPSDMAWMEMTDNAIDLVIGPIEHYEDQLYNYKTAFEGYVLIKDQEWSERLARYAKLLPELQKGLPVPEAYKEETPGRDSELNAYDAVYYAGDCNAGAKTIAINLPNDEVVQLEKGSRRLQLKNAMKAKFDEILLPITGQLIAEDQRQHVTFDAFFGNTMFHEVAHGLGIKETVTDMGSVRDAMKDQGSALEEGKADVLGLYLVTKLHEMGELGDRTHLMDNYVTFIASIFRSIRFGTSSAHGKANLVRFNYFEEMGAFTREARTGTYRIDFDKMEDAMNALSNKILILQGDGDYQGAVALMEEYGVMGEQLEADLERLNDAGIPVDVVFEQGAEELGL
jgi:hypothetical protein